MKRFQKYTLGPHLQFDQPTVNPFLGHQLLVGAFLDLLTLFEHHNPVGFLDGAQAMGHDQGGSSFHQGLQGLLDLLLSH